MRVFKGRKKRLGSFGNDTGSSAAFRIPKKSQVSTFVIIGLVILITVSILASVLVARYKGAAGREAEEAIETGVLPPLNVYIQKCIDLESPPTIFRLAEQGGVLEPKEGSYLYYNKTKLNYLCLVEGPSLEFACVNAFLTRQEMQRIISKEIANSLRRCINLKPFEAQGYNVEAGTIAVRTRIGRKSVLVEANYPINITKEGETTRVSDFSSEIDIPLGEIYELAMDITNGEIKEGYFDIDKWMAGNGADIIIEKHRPYPDIVYILSEKLPESFRQGSIRFQFTLQQNPSIAQRRAEQKVLYGLCKNAEIDDMCFENVQEAYCRQVKGSYIGSPEVSCIDNFRQPPQKPGLCDGHECRSCEKDFWGKKFGIPKKHGETWCVYDGITGKGYDYVGSRHYKHGCIDGKVYVEECRDYREEFCTENTVEGMNKAVCRINRWYDCSFCKTDQCCNDLRYRDCFWNYETTLKQKCVPYVPPGIRFWENEGIDTCLRANNKMDCEGISCPNAWIDDNARYCYQQADCGNYRNMADQLTKEGFFQSDPVDSVRNNIFLPEGWNKNPLDDGSGWSINLPIDTKEQPTLINPEEKSDTPLGNIPVLLSAALEFIDEIANLDFSDFLNPFSFPRLHIVDFTFCSVWTAPVKKNYCVLCGADPAEPCTEYSCKSLGQRCQFRMEEGMPKCELPSLVDKEPPKIEFNEEALTKDYSTGKAELAGHSGVKISPAIIPHKPFTIGIKTSEMARCRIKLAPRLPYFSLPSFWLNDPGFRTEHNITLRMPQKLSVPKKLLDFLNITSTSDIIPLLDNIEPLYNYYVGKLSGKFRLYTIITGDDIAATIEPKARQIINFIKGFTPYIRTLFTAMLSQFDRGGYYIFFQCTDMAGNDNKDEFFIQFEVNSSYVDREPPVIVYASPGNNSKISGAEGSVMLSLYVDEPADCRYSAEDRDFSLMEKGFACNTGYHISPVAGGTYECTALIDRNRYNITFVRCKDNPAEKDSYVLDVVLGNKSGIIGIEKYNYTNITADTYVGVSDSGIEAPAKMIEGLGFKVTKFPVDLKMYVADDLDCRFSNSTQDFDGMTGRFGRCRMTENIERGFYECDASLDRPLATNVLIANLTLKVKKADVASAGGGYLSEGAYINAEGSRITASAAGKIFGESEVSIDSSQMELSINFSSIAGCRQKTGQEAFEDMDCDAAENKTRCSYSAEIDDKADMIIECINKTHSEEQSYMFYIGCSEFNASEGNVNNESYVYTIMDAEPLDMTLKPEGMISELETELVVKVSGSISADGITCGYNDNPFYGMLNMDKIASDRFAVHLSGLEDGKKYRYYVQCYDRYGNEAEGFTEFEVVI